MPASTAAEPPIRKVFRLIPLSPAAPYSGSAIVVNISFRPAPANQHRFNGDAKHETGREPTVGFAIRRLSDWPDEDISLRSSITLRSGYSDLLLIKGDWEPVLINALLRVVELPPRRPSAIERKGAGLLAALLHEARTSSFPDNTSKSGAVTPLCFEIVHPIAIRIGHEKPVNSTEANDGGVFWLES